jgi:hypothetical protein
MVTIRVARKSSGKPAPNQRVSISFSGGRGVSRAEITDANGDAHFDVAPGTGKVIVNGTSRHEGMISGRTVIYI